MAGVPVNQLTQTTRMKTYKLVSDPIIHADGNGYAENGKAREVGLVKLEDVLTVLTE